MGRQPSLDPVEASTLKNEMFNGAEYAELMDKYGLGYQTVVNIKAGKQYRDIPWPDGSIGAMPKIQSRALKQARAFDTKMNKAMDARAGGAPSSQHNFTPEQLRHQDTLDAIFRETGMRFANIEESGAYFLKLVRDRNDKERAEQHQKELEAYRKFREENPGPYHSPHDSVSLPNDQCDPDANAKLDWDYITQIAGGNIPVVNAAETDPALKLAVQIMFKLISERDWNNVNVGVKQALLVKQKIERFWELNPSRAPATSSTDDTFYPSQRYIDEEVDFQS